MSNGKKKLNIFEMTVQEVEVKCLESKKELLELNLKAKREYISTFSAQKKVLRKNIARLKMILN